MKSLPGRLRLACCALSMPDSWHSVPPGRASPAEWRDVYLQAVTVCHTRGLLGPSGLHPFQGLLLLGPDPQLSAAGPALRRGAHRPRPQLHVLLGESAACWQFLCGTVGILKDVFAPAGAAVLVLLP